ncbi:glutamate synthase large subunit [Snodgrassella communis]|uniref:Glutamate synthase [NADPH] large chain n=1 Tax=Snodgrassella communis TaxID=2946699 RepID=A0A836MR52_9NEIS|nr:glutamate synthase large subunit [Snodgrassella communis]KDN15618.1 Glutamate synthase [NADPH] large chain [Snodgrassella communis]PIT11581.1 glutamate synthase large subunit [Snodgrassella communis]PIT25321.1 glutamate synthase large subunit [Snodgrassella communis]PIT26094.1 glutamate synthase large subunit [Snodgrassella communis]PIT37361.1 glutamate synthase large subunit [Snodgrassella communis]
MSSLYDHTLVKENCGFGLIANIEGEPSHKVVRTAILGLSRMQHRGAILSDGKTGDGCGLLLQMPKKFFQAIAEEVGVTLAKNFAVGMIFFPRDEKLVQEYKAIIEEELTRETLNISLWRPVPTNPKMLGAIALADMPHIEQVFINAPAGWLPRDLERRLFMTRRRIEKRINHRDFYICSLSNQVTIYKGLCMPKDLPRFYPDLADLRMQSAICLFHQRFSTNTLPRWQLAQPFRYLAHNGEINTISGNRAWARARSYKYHTPLIPDLQTAAPFVNETGSDSSSLDNMLELFVNGGMDLFRAMRLLVPPAWQHNPDMDEDLRAFYDFNSMHMEPWDGPAGIVLSDGRYAACTLDRNGLRPARYVITQDKLITIASEVGIWDYAPDEVVEKGRVGPGELLVIDTREGRLMQSADINTELKTRHPYKEWLDKNVLSLVPFEKLPDEEVGESSFSADRLLVYQKLFGYDIEELESVVRVLGENGQEAVGSMGDDTPFAVLSQRPRVLFDYFRQYFAQVTNPPIDPLREKHVMSLNTSIGREMSVFFEAEGMSHRVNFKSPVLLYSDMQQLLQLSAEYYQHHHLDAVYNPNEIGLKEALVRLCDEAVAAVRNGAVLLVISDRNVSRDAMPIPAVLSVGAIQQRLVETNLRCDANIIVETASARNPHHFAVLIGLGATAVYPYLAYESLARMVSIGAITKPLRQVMINFRDGINKGLYKIISKMGISTISSYRCACLFEAIGFHQEVMELCFKNMLNRIEGATFAQLDAELRWFHKRAWQKSRGLEIGGYLKYKPQGEFHTYNPEVVNTLQAAVNSGDYANYRRYADTVNKRPPSMLRDLLRLKTETATPIALEQVEAAENLYKRFDSAAMSIGALSPEAHEALATAMNRLGGFSNSGEGGEDPRRYGTERVSRIKQVASGRFGVTPAYLMSADVIQIKVAQGAKPGEGGQLPGDKVTPYIAQLRFAVPGSTLISPPPHHDIYSIEDLAQLIFDLKQINPRALISVKLVSLPGVGTIATGVAKAYADLITISGYDGGTGASPITSVKYAGSPWELGLAEAQQALVENNLRHKVRLQVDGGLKTGLDIVKAAILGAESFGFGTGPMIALGCRYLRICHLNNCATGVATQDDTLRQEHFHGLPEKAMNYFRFIAQDVREIMAQLGVSQLTDLIGRTELLEIVSGITPKQSTLNLSKLLYSPKVPDGSSRYCTQTNPPFDSGRLNRTIMQDIGDAVQSGADVDLSYDINNTDRSVGATLSGQIAAAYGNRGHAPQRFDIYLNGTAGQSFGVWLAGTVNLYLTGDANDYVGKGMAGGKIVIHPHGGTAFRPENTTIIGNTCLYGATGGKLFASGKAGERFAVRNSGATVVVEGIGDNGCEYMTGGVVCVLGKTGINFGAGMTGGFAYVLDVDGGFKQRINPELVEGLDISALSMHQENLRGLIAEHVENTHSPLGERILAKWDNYVNRFVLVKPKANDVDALLGHKPRTVTELRAVTQ